MIKKTCPYCGSTATQKMGTVMRVNKGRQQRYLCRSCGHYFQHPARKG